VMAQVRYRQEPVPARVRLGEDGTFELDFDEPLFAVTTGQSAVLYDGDRLLGGGVITARR
jgi:tRNA-specific 2-thiouridylase